MKVRIDKCSGKSKLYAHLIGQTVKARVESDTHYMLIEDHSEYLAPKSDCTVVDKRPKTISDKKIMKAHRFHPDTLKMMETRSKAVKMNRSEYISALIELDSTSKILKAKK